MQNIRRWIFTGIFAAASSTPALSDDSYVIIGGGPVPDASQISIEQNVLWIDDMLQKFGFSNSHVLFGAGKSGALDVVLHTPDNPEIIHWLPLARLYGKQQEARTQYRANVVSRSEGSADKQSVTTLLENAIKPLKADDSLLLIYSGHGSYDPQDVSKNSLRLWGDSRLDVNEFAHILNTAPANTTVRYVLPQCFSGAFARSILSNPAKPVVANSAINRCGFFAVDERTIAEGCTAGLNAGDYRDYATYFIAALAGKNRLGEPLTAQPDLNGDGEVSLHEAHVYAYTEGFSTDIPRSTSDYYLELWEPWFTRWHSFVPLSATNPYWLMAQRIAMRLHIKSDNPAIVGSQALENRRRLNTAIIAETQKHDANHNQAEQLQKEIKQRFLRSWPNAMYPQSAAYTRFLRDEADQALPWITAQPEYAKLAALQDGVSASALTTLELRREDAQYARLLRALHLAAIKENFDRLATPEQQDHYAALTNCEAWIPPAQTPVTGK